MLFFDQCSEIPASVLIPLVKRIEGDTYFIELQAKLIVFASAIS